MSESVRQNSKSRVEEEEEDLDDLDDVLDQFSPPPPPQPQPQPQPSSARASTSVSTSAQPTEEGADDALMKELADEMATLFKGFGIGAPRVDSEAPDGIAEREQLAVAWEAMLVEGMSAAASSSSASVRAEPSSQAPARGPGPKGEDDFRSRIRSTMDKLKESESGLKSSDASAGGGGDETFESFMSQLKDFGDGGVESEEQLQGVLEAMMGQLMSKDVLYEPLKELHDKFPGYLVEHSSTISAEDKTRFDAQIVCIRRLLDEFEAKSYRDDDNKAHGKIVELMGELQTHGSPPEEIMGPLPPGFSMGTDGLPNVPEGCNIN